MKKTTSVSLNPIVPPNEEQLSVVRSLSTFIYASNWESRGRRADWYAVAAKPKHSSALSEMIFNGRYDFHMHTVRNTVLSCHTNTFWLMDGWMGRSGPWCAHATLYCRFMSNAIRSIRIRSQVAYVRINIVIDCWFWLLWMWWNAEVASIEYYGGRVCYSFLFRWVNPASRNFPCR